MSKKRIAVAGTSLRAWTCFIKPMVENFSHSTELVAFHDISQVHMDIVNKSLPNPVPTYLSLDDMLANEEFDTLLVGSMDAVHHEHIIKGLRAGRDVISEKPMTIDAEKCLAILRAEHETGHTVTVTFNKRYTPLFELIRKLISENAIGKVRTIHLNESLGKAGASYFQRWHRYRKNSGGVQVHKSTHNFDGVNWWLQEDPIRVSACGGLDFYGKKGPFRHTRCTGCPHAEVCEFHWAVASHKVAAEYYIEGEKETGYIRDGCVFDESTDIEDNFDVTVEYPSKARLHYSLNLWSAWTGTEIRIIGHEGQIHSVSRRYPYEIQDPTDGKVYLTRRTGESTLYSPPRFEGGHEGGDPRLLRQLFESGHADPLGQAADSRAAALSLLTGVATTMSMQNDAAWISIPELMAEFA